MRPPPAVDLDAAYAYPPGEAVTVRANMIASVDGAATPAGGSGVLSGPADRRLLVTLRGLADVVLVGAETVRAESYRPARTSAQRRERRRAAGMSDQPPMAVVSRRLELDPADRFFAEAASRPIVLTAAGADPGRRRRLAEVADVVTVGGNPLDAGGVLAALADRGLRRVLCEGGPRLLAHLVRAGRLDELCLTVSPRLLPGASGRLLAGVVPDVVGLRLLHVLAEDGFVFLRYAVESASGVPPSKGPATSSSAASPMPPGSP